MYKTAVYTTASKPRFFFTKKKNFKVFFYRAYRFRDKRRLQSTIAKIFHSRVLNPTEGVPV